VIKPFGMMLACLAVLAPACGGGPGGRAPVPISDSFFSFEDNFEGWTTYATDVGEQGGTVDDWSISRSQDLARDGTVSIKLFLENANDAGKIWIERPFLVQPNGRYRVQVQYAFASEDWGDVNFWTIIAGVLPERPQMGEDLRPAFQGDTSNGNHTAPTGFVWLDKSYTFTVQSDASATLHVVIGVWGTYEVARTYYVDSVHVTIDEI
jgi:hypothetical protein